MSDTVAAAVIKKVAKAPTVTQYTNLQLAYEYFNRKLFNGELADCILVFGRDVRKCYGYFHSDQWSDADGDETCHMISLTPMHLNRPLEEVFSTLVHEMCHLWQQDEGKPSKNGYHNKEWADMMESVGLMPSTTGQPEGKRTGSRVSHYIISNGPYAIAFETMPDSIKLPWVGAAALNKKKTNRNKVAYQCFTCESKVWGKPGMNIVCGDCDETYQEM